MQRCWDVLLISFIVRQGPIVFAIGAGPRSAIGRAPDSVSQGSWVRYPVWQHTFVSPSAFSRRAVVSYWRKYVHEVLVNRLGGLSLPRKSVVRLTDRPDITLDVYRGRKTTIHQYMFAIGAGGDFLDIFSLVYFFFLPLFGREAQYRLYKYCLKGPLSQNN